MLKMVIFNGRSAWAQLSDSTESLDIPLRHGWLVGPESGPVADAVGQQRYNQLIEFIIEAKGGAD